MSDICKGVGTIWSRLFDHRVFLGGEINFTLNEFELKRGDKEVDNLFKTIENITDVKDTEIDRFKQAAQSSLPKTTNKLSEALAICQRITNLENLYKESDHLEVARQQRILDWESFMDYITTSYSELDSFNERKKESLKLQQ